MILGTPYKRRKYYTKKFPYVEPVKIHCGPNEKKTNFFYYIPIEDTLKNVMECKSYGEYVYIEAPCIEDEILRDFTDGAVFRNNQFFKDNPRSLRLILYQDAFDIVNPLGSAKSTHSIMAVYLSIGNMPPHLRSHVNSMQLVALCPAKNFNHQAVYEGTVRDLKRIESQGILLKSGERIKGSLVFIAGDNLGSNGLGGFSENFSRSPYFCRYCYVSRKEYYAKNGVHKIYES